MEPSNGDLCLRLSVGPRARLTRCSTHAVSLGTPLLVLFLMDLDGLGVTRRGLIDPELTFDPPDLYLTGVPVALALVALVRHQNRGLSPGPP